MPKTAVRLAIAAALTIAAVAPLQGQGLTQGTWTGTISPPGMEAIPVQFEVSGSGSALSISVTTALFPGAISLNDIRVEGTSMTFWFEPGPRVECTLTRDDTGGYAGPCTDGSADGGGGMTMVPPGAE